MDFELHKGDHLDLELTTSGLTDTDLATAVALFRAATQPGGKAVIEKTSGAGIVWDNQRKVHVVSLEPADTADLPSRWYAFEGKLTVSGRVRTVLDGTFHLLPVIQPS